MWFAVLSRITLPANLGFKLPISYANITGQSSYWALYFHGRYGHVLRMAPDEPSYSDSSSANKLLIYKIVQHNGDLRSGA